MWTIFRNDGVAVATTNTYLEAKFRAERLTDQRKDSRDWFVVRPTSFVFAQF